MSNEPIKLTSDEIRLAEIKAGLRRKPVAKWVYVSLAIMLIYALFAHDADYFDLLRFALCGGCGYIAYQYKNTEIEAGWFWVMVALAITFNPFVPFHNDRSTWALIDLGAAAFIMLALRRDYKS